VFIDAKEVVWKRGRKPMLRWQDQVRRDLERVGEERRTRAKYRGSWRLLLENAVERKLRKKKRKGNYACL